ncbi:MAG: NADH-ubiquinone oxidoreductase-F iron-sulfur binding region domain-containing protein [Bacteroidales bacterium]|jgi:NADH-quinone oxidoreductase subunit F|nr:NADH-ubiquinone oxidoreductase-F iron-sulfur binding region domain-containing protein [Bacteroidales bacterium]
MSENLRGLSERKGLEDNLFEEISKAGTNSDMNIKDVHEEIEDRFLIGKSSVLGVSTFYDFLRKQHSEKKVFVCDGTSCLTSGRQKKLKAALLENFSEDEIGTVTCLGHCHSNNAFKYDHRTVIWTGNRINGQSLNDPGQSHPRFHTGTNTGKPALMSETGNLLEYYGILRSYCRNIPKAIEQIEKSGLRGRGGAGFSFSAKKKASRSAIGSRKYIVCNADEGDPGAFSDKWLLEERPHAVLFGMMAAGMITGADTGIIYIRGEYPESVKAVNKAIGELAAHRINSRELWKCDKDFRFHVVEGAGAYICGEETSLLNSLEGLRPEVRTRPPYPATYGLFGKPTLLSNVETFANINYILKEGGEAYSLLGTEKSPGSKLVSLDGGFNRPGLYEVRMGTQLSEVIDGMGGGTRFPVKAFQIGGPLGGIVPASKVHDLTVDFESFAGKGFLLGHAGIVSVPEYFRMIEFLWHLFDFTARESCGKCFPCRIGARRGEEMLAGAMKRDQKISRELFTDLLETLQFGSLCALGGGLPLPVRNALDYFPEELDKYFR